MVDLGLHIAIPTLVISASSKIGQEQFSVGGRGAIDILILFLLLKLWKYL